MKNLSLFLLLTLMVAVSIFAATSKTNKNTSPANPNGGSDNPVVSINSFEECAAVYPVQESYPERCLTPDGKSFTRDIGNVLEKRDLIEVISVQPNAEVSSPLAINGQARGNWYFEAEFPVKIYDANDNLLGQGTARADGDWMTDEFVPFSLTLTFKDSPTATGNLILERSNASGLVENDDSMRIPVKFR